MISTKSIVEIEQVAQQLLQAYYGKPIKDMELPINPVAIATYLELTVYKSKLDENVDGIYNKARKSIYVPNDAPPHNRVTFTIAHELGHYCLHKNKDFDVFYRRYTNELDAPMREEEQQANIFAAELLMPALLIKQEYQTYKTQTKQNGAHKNITSHLAQLFQVSEEAMKWRLHNVIGKVNI